MKLVHAFDYAIRRRSAGNSDTPPTSEIVVAGVPTGKIVAGAVFQAALQWHDYVLLFLTDDVPFEDTLSIYMLDKNVEVVDVARMYFIYSTGVFSDLDLTQDDAVRFSFFGGIRWTLTLLHQKKFAIPIISDPRGVSRPLRFFRWFDIHGRPLPAASNAGSEGSSAAASTPGH